MYVCMLKKIEQISDISADLFITFVYSIQGLQWTEGIRIVFSILNHLQGCTNEQHLKQLTRAEHHDNTWLTILILMITSKAYVYVIPVIGCIVLCNACLDLNVIHQQRRVGSGIR